MAPHPIVILGTVEGIARAVENGLKPEYEVIKTVWNVEESKRELPGLLRSSSPPEAIVAGGAYPKDAILEIQEACKGAGGNNVPWLVHATYWNGGRPTPGPGYNEEITNRVKKTLGEAVGGGKKSDIFKY